MTLFGVLVKLSDSNVSLHGIKRNYLKMAISPLKWSKMNKVKENIVLYIFHFVFFGRDIAPFYISDLAKKSAIYSQIKPPPRKK